MTKEDHKKLLEIILQHPGPVMISGYDNDLYNDLLEGWHKETRLANCEGGQQRIEVIWMNYEPPIKQISIFDK